MCRMVVTSPTATADLFKRARKDAKFKGIIGFCTRSWKTAFWAEESLKVSLSEQITATVNVRAARGHVTASIKGAQQRQPRWICASGAPQPQMLVLPSEEPHRDASGPPRPAGRPQLAAGRLCPPPAMKTILAAYSGVLKGTGQLPVWEEPPEELDLGEGMEGSKK